MLILHKEHVLLSSDHHANRFSLELCRTHLIPRSLTLVILGLKMVGRTRKFSENSSLRLQEPSSMDILPTMAGLMFTTPLYLPICITLAHWSSQDTWN